MGVKTYSASEMTIIFKGVIVEGLADGTFVTVGRKNPAAVGITGSDGEGARAMSNDKSGTCVCTLLQTSVTNDFFSDIQFADENGGDGVGKLLVKDGTGRTVASAETAWIEKLSDAEFAREITNREWTIETDHLEMHVGGN